MIVYCDYVSVRVVLFVLARRLRSRGGDTCRVLSLDPLQPGMPAMLVRLLRGSGCSVEEVPFFAGHLRGPDGDPPPLAARAAAFELSYEIAEDSLRRSRTLDRLNARGPRNTLLLHLAKRLWLALEPILLACLVSDALAARDRTPASHVLLHTAWPFDRRLLARLLNRREVRVWRRRRRSSDLFNSRVPIVSRLGRLARGVVSSSKATARQSPPPQEPGVPGSPSPENGSQHHLLMIEDADELSTDRSYRTQPYWLFPDRAPRFSTFVIRSRATAADSDPSLARSGVRPIRIPPRAFLRGWRLSALWVDAARCLVASAVTASAQQTWALRAAAVLHARAYALAVTGRAYGVKVMMTCENHAPDADAMQLAAAELGATTISYQYANPPFSSPALMTTADVMVTFAPSFDSLWTRTVPRAIAPGRFESDGYVFDASFALLTDRARRHEAQLRQQGARFIVGYLDESVQDGKYGLIERADHRAEMMALMRMLLSEPDMGLIVKTQFQRNTPSVLYGASDEFAAVRSTGRYLELVRGANRNTVFPAEAAFASDLVIGHLVGGTAALESALTGTRTVMIDPYNVRSRHEALYRSANIVFPSLASALDAIVRYRRGAPETQNLGDWSAILPAFDPYRDGQSGHRMRARLEALLCPS